MPNIWGCLIFVDTGKKKRPASPVTLPLTPSRIHVSKRMNRKATPRKIPQWTGFQRARTVPVSILPAVPFSVSAILIYDYTVK